MELKAKTTEPNKNDPAVKYGDDLRSLLETGEELRGVSVGSWQKNYFSTAVVLLGVTDRRVVIKTLDRRGRLKDEPEISVYADDIAKAGVGGGGAFGSTAGLVDSSSITVKLKTHAGEKYKLSLMNGEGLLGAFSGPSQRVGAEALAAFAEARAR